MVEFKILKIRSSFVLLCSELIIYKNYIKLIKDIDQWLSQTLNTLLANAIMKPLERYMDFIILLVGVLAFISGKICY